jgi:hypothetical protein
MSRVALSIESISSPSGQWLDKGNTTYHSPLNTFRRHAKIGQPGASAYVGLHPRAAPQTESPNLEQLRG